MRCRARGENDRAAAYSGRGMVYRVKGHYDRAIADYTKGIEPKPPSLRAPKLSAASNHCAITRRETCFASSARIMREIGGVYRQSQVQQPTVNASPASKLVSHHDEYPSLARNSESAAAFL